MIYLPDNPVLWVLLFATGAVIGSFLNVVIYRWPRQESVIQPPSHCMSCGKRLTAIDLIPILSYIFLRGRCRHCKHAFSPRYALVELASGLLLVGCLAGPLGASWHALLVYLVCCCLLLVFFIDLDHIIIPDELVIVIAAVGVVVNGYYLVQPGFGVGGLQPGMATSEWPVTNALTFTQMVGGEARTVFLPASLVGITVGAGAFLFISWFFERFFHKPVMGLGDVKLAGAMGAIFGPGSLFIAWFLISVVVGAAVAVLLLALRIRKRREYIPFGPMLALGGIVLLLFPEVGAFVLQRYSG